MGIVSESDWKTAEFPFTYSRDGTVLLRDLSAFLFSRSWVENVPGYRIFWTTS